VYKGRQLRDFDILSSIWFGLKRPLHLTSTGVYFEEIALRYISRRSASILVSLYRYQHSTSSTWRNDRISSRARPIRHTTHSVRIGTSNYLSVPVLIQLDFITTNPLCPSSHRLKRHHYTPNQTKPNLYAQNANQHTTTTKLTSLYTMRHTTPNDSYIIYGRGGAGNIRTSPPLRFYKTHPTNTPPRPPLNNPHRVAQAIHHNPRHGRGAVADD
jgi:hypothetical protein